MCSKRNIFLVGSAHKCLDSLNLKTWVHLGVSRVELLPVACKATMVNTRVEPKDSFQRGIVCAVGKKADTANPIGWEEAVSRPQRSSSMSLIDDCNELPSMENW